MCSIGNIEDVAGGLGLTSDNLGLPTVPEITGAEAAKEAERQATAEFEAEQLQMAKERQQAYQALVTSATSVPGGPTTGRASTILTGGGRRMPGGSATSLLGSASSTLLRG